MSAPIRTARLLLRDWRETDRAPFAAMNADAEVMEFYPAPLTRAESDAFVDRMQQHLDAHGWGLWAVEVAATEESAGAPSTGTASGGAPFIGYVGLAVPRFDPGMVEIGWRLTRPAWGRGYATEAARAALDVAFGRLGLPQVVSFTSVPNVRSQRVMQRIGMVRDPAADFDHPGVPDGSPLKRHVLYRIDAPH